MQPLSYPQRSPFYFLRHGETDWNRDHIYMGSQDIPLNQLGIEQAKLAALRLKHEPISYIISSPLQRAQKTAEIIALNIGKEVIVMDEFRECSLGVKEGQSADEGYTLKHWLNGGFLEGAEELSDFKARVTQGFTMAFKLSGPVLIVAHGGVYRVAQKIYNWPTIAVSNCTLIYHKLMISPENPWHLETLML